MGYYCTVPQCTSLAGKTKNVKFHRFPRDVTMADKWNVILKRGKPYTKYSKVCSLHFTQSDYNVTTMGKNKATAYYLGFPYRRNSFSLVNVTWANLTHTIIFVSWPLNLHFFWPWPCDPVMHASCHRKFDLNLIGIYYDYNLNLYCFFKFFIPICTLFELQNLPLDKKTIVKQK